MRIPLVRTSVFVFAAALPAFATDGVIEINQAKAIAGGVSAGDGAGFPVTLSTPGSYRLTSNLDLTFLGLPTSANTDAIHATLNAGPLTIDLNGFALLGPAVCNGGACLNIGSGVGINSEASFLLLRNGFVKGMGSNGIYTTLQMEVENVSATSNGASGFSVEGGTLRDCTSFRNGVYGFQGGSLAVRTSRAFWNEQYGVIANFARVHDSLIGDNALATNGAELICYNDCALSGNQFYGCTGAACFGGSGTILQLPLASNMCGNTVCP